MRKSACQEFVFFEAGPWTQHFKQNQDKEQAKAKYSLILSQSTVKAFHPPTKDPLV